MSRAVLSGAAATDRRDILEYTVAQFGEPQAARFLDQLEAVLNTLLASPLIGRIRKDFDPPGREFRYAVLLKRFVIVYEPLDDGIRVARLLHGARDVAGELEHDGGDNAEADSKP